MRPPHAVLLSLRNTYRVRAGNSAYLGAIAGALAGQGVRLTLLLVDVAEDGPPLFRIARGDAAPYADIRARGYVRVGGWFVRARVRSWARACREWLRRRTGRDAAPAPTGDGALWRLPEPSPAGAAWSAKMCARLAPDALIANYFNAAELFPAVPSAPVRAVLVHDVMACRAASIAAAGLPSDTHPEMLARERPAFAAADLLIAIQPGEAAWLAENVAGPRVVEAPMPLAVPPGPPPEPLAAAPPRALFVGGANSPNFDALDWLLDAIWPIVRAARPTAELHLAGHVCARRAGWPDGVVAHGVVADLAPLYAAADVALVPIRFGSGLKIKLVEALGAGVPVMSTTIGAEGVAPPPAGFLRIADEAADYAAAVIAMFDQRNDPAPRRAARAWARDRFCRARIGARLAAALFGR